MFGSKKQELSATIQNVPIYTTETINVPEGHTVEYVGVITLHTDRVGSGDTFLDNAVKQFQSKVNVTDADAVVGVKIMPSSNGIRNYIDIYGTAIKFVPSP